MGTSASAEETVTSSSARHRVTAPTGLQQQIQGETRIYELRPEGRLAAETAGEFWLIALKGGLIYAAGRYRIEDAMIRFITLHGEEYVISLEELDFDFTAKLNAERGLEFDPEPSP